MKTSLAIKFWGVRGSHPVPGPNTLYYGGNTPCVEINVAGQTIILDMGTGSIVLGDDLLRRARSDEKPIRALILLSHLHHDHVQGFPFFSPAFLKTTHIDLFGPHYPPVGLERVLMNVMSPPFFPVTMEEMRASKTVRSLDETQMLILDVEKGAPQVVTNQPPGYPTVRTHVPVDKVVIHTLQNSAHPGGVMVYRIEYQGLSVVYATDTEGYAHEVQRLVDFARGADLLIHDAQYTEQHYTGQQAGAPSTRGWGHSTPDMACDVALEAGVKQLALFHYEPRYDDAAVAALEQTARRKFPRSFAAYEGLEISLSEQGDGLVDIASICGPRASVRSVRRAQAGI